MTQKTNNTGIMPISIGERLANREGFMPLFREGMGLLEETADYLDGPGREDARVLNRVASLAYATESMKLTTRLMQIASWLLLQRAVNDGEISGEQALREKSKIKLTSVSSEEASAFDELPGKLKELVGRSHRIQERVRHLDTLMRNGGNVDMQDAAINPLQTQLDALRNAFSE